MVCGVRCSSVLRGWAEPRRWTVRRRWAVRYHWALRHRWAALRPMDEAPIGMEPVGPTTAWVPRTGWVARAWEPDWRAEAGSLAVADWFG